MVTAEDVEAVLVEAVERAMVNLKFIWDDSSLTEQLVLLALREVAGEQNVEVKEEQVLRILAKHDIGLPRGEVVTALRNLVGREVLSGTDSYKFTVDLLR